MWDFATATLDGGRGLRFALSRDGAPVGYGRVLKLWRLDEGFRTAFMRVLAEAPFAAYRWETPPVTQATVARPFAFVLLDAPELDSPADAVSFADRFANAPGAHTVVDFPNLGGDAILVVPKPMAASSAYTHLAAFIREAPAAQRHELWQTVGAAMEARRGVRPVWLSTAGAGVAWLHVRLDSRPKYYGHRPYAQER